MNNVRKLLDATGSLHRLIDPSVFAEKDLSRIHSGSRVEEELLLQEESFYEEKPLTLDQWPPHQMPDGDYCNFGTIEYVLHPAVHDWTKYTKLRFRARALGIGARTPFIYVHLKNEGAEPMPDIFGRTGLHQISLTYGKWTDCVWEIAELPRDNITEIRISLLINGSDNAVGHKIGLAVEGLKLQKSQPFISNGWRCDGVISYSQSGYRLGSVKQAITMMPVHEFVLEREGGSSVTMPAKKVTFRGDDYYVMDFTKVNQPEEEGLYRIRIPEDAGCDDIAQVKTTEFFPIGEDIWDEATLKLTNYIFSERCGYPVPGKHLICHSDVYVEHNGKKMSYQGGWHDAGDLSQQTLQTAEIALSLHQASDKAFRAGKHRLADRLQEEAQWGDAFMLKTRFGDGFRATSAGLTRWTRGLWGDMDDVTARCHDHDFENFMFAMAEAKASLLERDDASLKDQLLQAAVEDYDFAVKKLPDWDKDLPSFYEHSYNSSYSLHMAAAISAAASLMEAIGRLEEEERDLRDFEFAGASGTADACGTAGARSREIVSASSSSCGEDGTGEGIGTDPERIILRMKARWYQDIRRFTEELLKCQDLPDEDGRMAYDVTGFFYRSESEKEPVHFNHQSREYLFAQALVSAHEVLSTRMTPENMVLVMRVETAMEAYGGYLKQLMTYASPYGMIPAGIQLLSETENEKTFELLHLFASLKDQKESMIRQIMNGVPAGGEYELKRDGAGSGAGDTRLDAGDTVKVPEAYIRQFPVWFSFRGNNAIFLSQGMGARILGEYLKDEELLSIADRQLYFVTGLNPFGQSLIYGEGHAYAPQYGAQLGLVVGEIPVGMETHGDSDEPYYPEANNATYKEIWTSPAARFLAAIGK